MPSRYLVDTNVLLRLTGAGLQQDQSCQAAIDRLLREGSTLFYTLQNAAEFWNVSTRPADRNGHGRPFPEVAQRLRNIESTLTLLPDDLQVYATWRTLVETHQIRGVQVHDARLAAAMLVHNVPHILTLNTADFARFPGIEAVHPAKV